MSMYIFFMNDGIFEVYKKFIIQICLRLNFIIEIVCVRVDDLFTLIYIKAKII